MRSSAALVSSRGRQASRPLIVELIGVPGAGKTTTAAELVSMLRRRGVDAATIVDAARPRASMTMPGRMLGIIGSVRLRRLLLWQVFYVTSLLSAPRMLRSRPALLRHAVGTLARRPFHVARLRRVLVSFVQLAGRYSLLTRAPCVTQVLVLDDGFLHRSVHIHAFPDREPDDSLVRSYVELVPEPDVVVFARADRELCERRVYERGVWDHARHLTRGQIERYLANSERVANLAVRHAEERGWHVVSIDTGRDGVDGLREELRRELEHGWLAVEFDGWGRGR